MKEYEEGDIIIGTVDRLIGTSVFVKLDGQEGVINFSEVAPGRIRNIRDYVNPGQKIVVKIIRVDKEKGNIDLSLRRVTQKEKKEVLENEKKEKELFMILKLATKDEKKAQEILDKIRSKTHILEFFEGIHKKDEKENLSFLKSAGLNDQESKDILNILKEKIKEKKINIKMEFTLSSHAEEGIERIKKALSIKKDKVSIKYLGAPLYSINVEDNNYKDANRKMKEVLDILEKNAKAEGLALEVKEKQ